MTQQQIAYMNAVTSRDELANSRMRSEAAMLQAEQAKRQRDWEEGTKYWTDLGTGVLATVGGILALALL